MVNVTQRHPQHGGGETHWIPAGNEFHVVDMGSLFISPNDTTRDGYPMQVSHGPGGFTVSVDTTVVVRRLPFDAGSALICPCADPTCFCLCRKDGTPCTHG